MQKIHDSWEDELTVMAGPQCTKVCTCKKCGRTSLMTKWARINGEECGDCKAFADVLCKGTLEVTRALVKSTTSLIININMIA